MGSENVYRRFWMQPKKSFSFSKIRRFPEPNEPGEPKPVQSHEPLAKLDEVTENKQIGSSEFCKCSIRTSTTRSGSALRQRDMDPGPQFGCHQSTPIQRFRRSFASPSHQHKIFSVPVTNSVHATYKLLPCRRSSKSLLSALPWNQWERLCRRQNRQTG